MQLNLAGLPKARMQKCFPPTVFPIWESGLEMVGLSLRHNMTTLSISDLWFTLERARLSVLYVQIEMKEC